MPKQTPVIIATFLLLATAGFLYISWGEGFDVNFGASRVESFAPGDFFIDFDGTVLYQSASDELGFYIFGRRNIRRYDIEGNRLWERTTSHANPTSVQGGNYIGISAYRARAYYAFGPYGALYTIATENDILSYHIACNGYSAILSVTDYGSYHMEVFNTAGMRVWQRILKERNVFPISMAISPDATTLIVSYLDTSGHTILSYICAYHIYAEGSMSYDDGLFASFSQIEGEIISRVAFIDSKHLMYSSDGRVGMYIIDYESRISHVWSRILENQAVFVEVVRGVGVAVAYGRPLPGAEGVPEGTFVIYGLEGWELATYFMSGGIRYLSTGSGAAIIGGGALRRDFAAIDYNNQVVWEYTATSDVLDFVILDSPMRALIVTPMRMQIMEAR